MKRKESVYEEWIEGICTYEDSAVPLKINRMNSVLFGCDLHKALKTLLINTEEQPKNYFYALWLLEL